MTFFRFFLIIVKIISFLDFYGGRYLLVELSDSKTTDVDLPTLRGI